MPDEEPTAQPARDSPRRRALTPEQRRFLGTPRAREKQEIDPELVAAPEKSETLVPRKPAPEATSPNESPKPEAETKSEPEGDAESRISAPMLRPDQTIRRTWELQRAILILGGIILVGLTFFVGMKFPYWQYRLFTSRHAPKVDAAAKKFPNLTAEELVDQALVAQRAGNFVDAGERFLAAKHKNLGYRGILFRVGKMAYDHRDFATADKLFENAIQFRENIDVANYLRGMIAVRRADLAAARRFFEAAIAAEPFVADYHYNLAEALRLDHHPLDAIPRYEHAALLVATEGEVAICQFKIRMARLEAADGGKVAEEVEAHQKAGKLSVDWLLTAAAVHLRAGELDQAVPLILLARNSNQPDVFATCIRDPYFVEAARKNPRLAEVSQVPAN